MAVADPMGLSLQCCYSTRLFTGVNAEYQPLLMAASHGHLGGHAESFSEAKVIVPGRKAARWVCGTQSGVQ